MDYSDRKNITVIIGADHGGYEAKEFAKEYIRTLGYELVDIGTDSDISVDYPDFGIGVAKEVMKKKQNCGIIFCGTGIGISISANKVKGIRAALCTSDFHAEMARRHNDANILAMGGRVSTYNEIQSMIDIWFSTPFDGGRHKTRVDKIHNLSEC